MSDNKNQRGFFSKLRHLASVIVGRDARRRARSLAAKLEKEKQRANELGETCKFLCPAAMTALLDANARDGISPFNMSGRGLYMSAYEVVRQAMPALDWTSASDGKADFCFVWGMNPIGSNIRVVASAVREGARLVLCEDGFLRSADTWANASAAPRYRHGCSVVYDTLGFYFDATRPSSIEKMLNDPALKVTPEQCAEARRLIDRIVSSKLTKYNHQPIFTPQVGRPGRRKVLVVDQSYGDQAIARGWGSDQTFADMLEDAKRENPDADIIVKTHPDTMTGKRGGYYTGVKEEGNVFRMTAPVNPYSLMEIVDKVYVCSTQMGFEALMAGKEVHVYGMPFYAGWGLTIDKQENPRRTNNRTLEEAFYIFYILYTHWVDIETGRPCTIDKAMDNLMSLRDEYAALRRGASS